MRRLLNAFRFDFRHILSHSWTALPAGRHGALARRRLQLGPRRSAAQNKTHGIGERSLHGTLRRGARRNLRGPGFHAPAEEESKPARRKSTGRQRPGAPRGDPFGAHQMLSDLLSDAFCVCPGAPSRQGGMGRPAKQTCARGKGPKVGAMQKHRKK